MLIVKLSTAATIEIGPVLDSTGVGVEYSGLAITELRLVKNGTGAAMASAASITHVANGHYTLVMTTGNTDTLGTLTVSCHKVGYQMPRVQMMVVPVKVYDSIVAGSDNLEVDAIQLLGTAILTPATAGTLDVNAKQFGGATVNATTSVTIPTSATLATTTGAVGSVTGNVTGSVASVVGAVGSVTGLTAANLDTTISSRASQTSLDTLDDLVDTEVGAIKTKTDQLTFTIANQVDSNSLTIGANVITASALATDAVNEIQSGLATPTNITAATGITVSSIGADVVTASALAASAVNEIADQVWDELLSGHTGVGSTGAGLSAAGAAGDPWSTLIPGSYGAGTAGKIVGDNVNATISSRASQTSLDTLDDLVDTEVGAIKTKTDQLTFTIANQVDSNSLTIGANVITASALATDAVSEIQSGLATPTNITAITGNITGNLSGSVGSVTNAVGSVTGAVTVGTINADVITASALATDAVNEIADQVWDELLSGHATAGSTGAGLTSASSAGDPWSTALPGSYGAGTAGKIVGDNVNATISSRASQTSLDTLDDLVDTEVGAIKTKTDQLTFTVANQIDANTLTIGNNVITAAAIATDAIGSAEISAAAVTKIQSGLATPTNITAGTITTVSSVTGLTAANLDTTVSSRASQTSLDALDDYVDTEVAAIKAKTDQLAFTVANQVDSNSLSVSATGIRTAVGMNSANLDSQISGLATPTNITAATGIVLSGVTHTGARIPNVTLTDTTTNLTNAPTAGDLTQTMKNSVTAIVPTAAENFAAVLTTAITESYAADNVAPTLAQAIMLIQQSLHEFAISSTTRTVKKLDGSTTAATFTLDSATTPTSTTRAT